MIGEFSNIKIQGISAAIPKYIENNHDFEAILGSRRVKRQIKITGVEERRISGPHQRSSDLCYEAAVPLMKHLDWKSEDIKVLIFITQGPNYSIPSTAFFLQQRLGIPKDCVAFDINLGCSSFNVGVQMVASLLQKCNLNDKALLLLADTAGKVMNPEEKIDEDVLANRMLFGSAGSAIAIQKVENHNIKYLNKSDGTGYEAIIGRPGIGMRMNGSVVFEFAINDVSDDVNQFKNHFDIKEDDIDYYVFHQAQKLILDNIADICSIPQGKELRSLHKYGNTSGPSVPLTLCDNIDKFKDKEKLNLFFCGFGVGLSWGNIYTEVDTKNILPVIETDAHYEDDKLPTGILKDSSVVVINADTPIGECISRHINSKAAHVAMVGKDKSKLNEIEADLYYESSVIESHDNNFEDILNKYTHMEIESLLSGIILLGDVDKNAVDCICKYLNERDMRDISVVLVGDTTSYSSFSQIIYENINNEIIRINAVIYDSEKVDIQQITGIGKEWVGKYIKSGCIPEMKRQLFIGDAVARFLSNTTQFTTGSTIFINR